MSRAKIADTALSVWLAGEQDNFSILQVAKFLNIVPATIRAHFKGGMADLEDEIARSALTALAPPYKPQQNAKDYLRDFFRAMMSAFHQKPQLGRLVVRRLGNDPLLCPVFADRMCATFAAIAEDHDVAAALQLFLKRLAGLVMMEAAGGPTGKPDAIKAKILMQTSVLSSTEFPTLKLVSEKLAADLAKRTSPGYREKVAAAAADALIAELVKVGS